MPSKEKNETAGDWRSTSVWRAKSPHRPTPDSSEPSNRAPGWARSDGRNTSQHVQKLRKHTRNKTKKNFLQPTAPKHPPLSPPLLRRDPPAAPSPSGRASPQRGEGRRMVPGGEGSVFFFFFFVCFSFGLCFVFWVWIGLDWFVSICFFFFWGGGGGLCFFLGGWLVYFFGGVGLVGLILVFGFLLVGGVLLGSVEFYYDLFYYYDLSMRCL